MVNCMRDDYVCDGYDAKLRLKIRIWKKVVIQRKVSNLSSEAFEKRYQWDHAFHWSCIGIVDAIVHLLSCCPIRVVSLVVNWIVSQSGLPFLYLSSELHASASMHMNFPFNLYHGFICASTSSSGFDSHFGFSPNRVSTTKNLVLCVMVLFFVHCT